ncbi:unnamed protein product [Prorocentrum cordatum]|uniref:Uncharacterized protein n=1 Tax=Prorocentrum cordatum TaxID=2364126 RepID=A0ABN9WFP8_9DINO|nr:unnamed protein product [Polarella glacialis]
MDSINVRYDKWTYGQLCVSESVQATTPGPTLAPTLAPTAAPTVSSAGATGDPHLQNMFGQRFDLMKPGAHVLINIPRGVRAENALLRVEAEARRMGRGCADMYFQTLNVTGQWAEAGQERGYQYDALSGSKESPRWLTIGKVEIKVTHGQTESGIRYLNFYVKHLGQVGFAVGGLLGEDDFTDAASIPDGCKKMTSLHPGAVARASNSSSLSVAIAIVA